MIEKKDFRVLIGYPNLSMMLTPSYAVGLFTAILKTQGYTVDLFDCTPYLATHEFMKEPLPVTRANKLLNSRKFDPVALFENKIVVDAGCGSGKFSVAIAKFGAKKVIGIDIGKKGLEFAKKQAKKTGKAVGLLKKTRQKKQAKPSVC